MPASSVSAPDVEAGGGLRSLGWLARRTAPLLVLLVVLGAALGGWAVQQRNTPRYDATAIVAAQQLAVSQLALPRFGSVVFSSGEVALDTHDRLGLTTRPSDLVPAKISVTPVQDTFLFQVVGHDADPEQAKALANTAADSFTEELNRPGRGIGTFQVVQPARFALRASTLPVAVGSVVGALAALLLGLGALWVAAALRRPVVSADEAAEVVGAPLLAEVSLADGTPATAGESARLRRLQSSTRALLVSGGTRAARHGVVRQVVAATEGPVSVLVATNERASLAEALGPDVDVCSDLDGLVGDAVAVLQLPRSLVASRAAQAVDAGRSLLLVRKGEARRAVQLRALHALGETVGVLYLVPRRGGPGPRPRPSRGVVAGGSVVPAAVPAGDVTPLRAVGGRS